MAKENSSPQPTPVFGWGLAWRFIRLDPIPREGSLVLAAEATGHSELRDNGHGVLIDATGTEYGTVDYETGIAHVGRPLKEGDLPGKPSIATMDIALSRTKLNLLDPGKLRGVLRRGGIPISEDGLTLQRGTLAWVVDRKRDGYIAQWVDGDEFSSSPLPNPPGFGRT